MIEAGRARRLVDEAIVRSQLVEPGAGGRRGEKSSQTADRRSKPRVIAGPAVDRIGPEALGLRPQPRHRIVDAAVNQHRADRHAAPGVEAVRIGKRDQPPDGCGLVAARLFRPAVEQERPFVMMTGLGDAALASRCWRPVGSEKLAQRAGLGIDELVEAERCDAVRHTPPGWVVVERDPRQRGFKQVHVRVGALRHSVVAVLVIAALRVGVLALQRVP